MQILLVDGNRIKLLLSIERAGNGGEAGVCWRRRSRPTTGNEGDPEEGGQNCGREHGPEPEGLERDV